MRVRPVLVLATAVLAVVACYEIGAPPGGVASISLARNPSPSVVVGDSSRDSTGQVAGVQVTAFNANGDTITDPPPVFIAIDRGIKINVATGVMFGDSVVPSGARIIASVGPLQTLPDTVPVTVAPVRFYPTQSVSQLAFDTVLKVPDTAATQNQVTLTLTVAGTPPATSKATDTMAVGFIVDWSIAHMPPGVKNQQAIATALLMDGGKQSTRDTTDRQGVASRLLQVRPIYFADPGLQIDGTKKDSVVVEAVINRRPAQLPNTTVKYVILVCLKNAVGVSCSAT